MRSWLAGPVHGYYFAVYFFIGIILGIVGCLVDGEQFFSRNTVVYIAITLMLVGLIKFRRISILFFLLAGTLIGLWRGSSLEVASRIYDQFYNRNVSVSGHVTDDVTFGPDGKQRFKLSKIMLENQTLPGEIWVSASGNNTIKRSDTVEASGFLTEGFGSFSASLVRANIHIVNKTSSRDFGLVVRDSFADVTVGIIPEPQRSLGLGYLLGLKSALPESLEKQIQILGLTHIVVASGYNLTILVSFARRLFVKVSKYLSAATGFIMIAGFMLITGFSPSMSRAGLVAGLSLLAWYYGRKIHPGTVLVVAAAITLLIKPSYIAGDLGWYLSFLAFFGVLILAPLIHHYFWGADRRPSFIRELTVATFSAQLITLPVIIYSFGAFSLYSLPANIVILPFIPLCMLAVFIAGVAGLIAPIVASFVALPAVLLLKYCTFMINVFSSISNVQIELDFNVWKIASAYLLIVLLTLFLLIKTKHNFIKDKIIVD